MTIRAPIFTRIPPARSPQLVDLLTRVEGLPPGEQARTIPLRQSDWPNPVLRRTNPDLRFWFDSLPPGEIARTIPPGQRDWPNPVRRQPTPWLYSVSFSLQIQPAVVQPPAQAEWTNPPPRRANLELRTWTNATPWPLTVGAPFAQTDWPLPPPRRQNLELRAWVTQTPWPLTVGRPFVQTDWPNPVRRIDSRELRTWSAKLNVASIGAPFSQLDWPNPVRRRDSVSLRSWTNGVQITGAVVSVPCNQFNWPNPIRRVDTTNLKGWAFSTRFELTVGNPFKQTDWPNPPRGRPFPVEMRGFINTPYPGRIPPAVPPAGYTAATIPVTAYRRGYFDGRIREVGDVFDITSPLVYSSYWMRIEEEDEDDVPDDWIPLIELRDETVNRNIIRPVTPQEARTWVETGEESPTLPAPPPLDS